MSNEGMERVQRLRDGSVDPLHRSVEVGFAVVVHDAGGQPTAWAEQMFATEDAANVTAARCVPTATDIRPARRISFFDGRHGWRRSTIILD